MATENLVGRSPYLITHKGKSEMALLWTVYQLDGFQLRAYSELESYFAKPEPYLEIDLTSAAVMARVMKTNSVLLVETKAENGRRVELPAGNVDIDVDRSITDTAVREFAEETGGEIELPELRALSVVHHEGRGGIQFYAEIPKIKVEHRDELGRGYLSPPEGTDKGRTISLITEPMDIFLDGKKSLLRHSQNLWAMNESVRQTLQMHTTEIDASRKKKNIFSRVFRSR